MAGRTITTTISIGGEVESSVQQAFARTSRDLETIQKAAGQAAGATDSLSAVIDEQSEALDRAKKAYTDYILGGETSQKKVKELEDEIERLNKELGKNRKRFNDAQEAANNCAEGCKDAKEAVRKATEEFQKWGDASKRVLAVTATSLIAVGTAILALGPATEEYRQNQGQLNAAFEQAVLTTDAATATYRQLYKVIGDDDQAIESAVNIAQLASSEEDAAKWAALASGILGTFHDTLQPEAFYEAANETLKLGEATGAFAQMLEQTGVMSVEEFNNKLAACTTEAEKQAFMLKVSGDAMGAAGAVYDEATASIQAQRDAQAKLNAVMAQVGEAISPINTALTELGADVLTQLTPYIEEFADKYLPDIVAALSDVGTAIGEAITWIADNWTLVSTLATIILGIAAALTVVSTVMGIVNAVMLASPVTWIVLGIVAAIAALIAIIVVCVKHWDQIKAAATSAVEWIVNAWYSIPTWLNENIVQPIAGFFSNLWSGIIGGINGMVSFFATAFQSLVGIVKSPINAVISIINGAIDSINAIGFDIPDWVPVIGGQKFSLDIEKLPMFAAGGFTDGVSIAGEAGTEAIISFDSRYRAQNLSYWAKAGRMLGADATDYFLGGSGSGSSISLGGVTFAPNISISGNADKESIMAAIEAEFPEFVDMLEDYFMQRSVTVYA